MSQTDGMQGGRSEGHGVAPPPKFQIHPVSRFDAEFPNFTEPSEVGHFSLDGTVEGRRNVYNDARKLRVYSPPKDGRRVAFDLGDGFERFVRKDDDIKNRLDHMLRWILLNKGDFETEGDGRGIESLNADFVMWRGHLTKILCTPYSKDSWSMAVTLFRGTRFMSEVETKENEKRRREMNRRELEMTYWGHKFEQYVTRESDEKTPNTSVPVDNHDAYCSVIRNKLKDHRLLFSGEVDCVRPGCQDGPPGNYVELKTSRDWQTERNERNFYRYKLIKWWAQSFLVGIPEVICGFRNDHGTVNYLKSFKTHNMPNLAKEHWSGSVAFNFCEQFLSFVKEVVTVSDEKKVYLFERRPDSSEITVRLSEDPSDVFLPDWFTSQFSGGNVAQS